MLPATQHAIVPRLRKRSMLRTLALLPLRCGWYLCVFLATMLIFAVVAGIGEMKR